MAKLVPELNSPLAYDPVNHLYWYTNLPLLVGTYHHQVTHISAINIHGFSHFRFATTQELISLASIIVDASNAFVFTPTEYPTLLNSQNGPGFYWTARTGDIKYVTPDGMTFRNYLYFYCDPLQSTSVSTSNQPNAGSFLGVEDHSAGVELPDLVMSAWVVGKKAWDWPGHKLPER